MKESDQYTCNQFTVCCHIFVRNRTNYARWAPVIFSRYVRTNSWSWSSISKWGFYFRWNTRRIQWHMVWSRHWKVHNSRCEMSQRYHRPHKKKSALICGMITRHLSYYSKAMTERNGIKKMHVCRIYDQLSPTYMECNGRDAQSIYNHIQQNMANQLSTNSQPRMCLSVNLLSSMPPQRSIWSIFLQPNHSLSSEDILWHDKTYNDDMSWKVI